MSSGADGKGVEGVKLLGNTDPSMVQKKEKVKKIAWKKYARMIDHI
jgi:hypothetical protein